LIATTFIAGTFVASPELRAFAANTVGSADIINNSIQSADIKDSTIATADLAQASVTYGKIKDGEVRAQEIAVDAVGASEMVGVTELIFADCSLSFNSPLGIGGSNCPVSGGIVLW
jgi:hypothetical protein